ncbi:unnamed protein product [Caenorhabditis sp. 36 PRJEB53466]|nr:unnamed protein product [Caenorhabditis sp. 36 PRJEB53466]
MSDPVGTVENEAQVWPTQVININIPASTHHQQIHINIPAISDYQPIPGPDPDFAAKLCSSDAQQAYQLLTEQAGPSPTFSDLYRLLGWSEAEGNALKQKLEAGEEVERARKEAAELRAKIDEAATCSICAVPYKTEGDRVPRVLSCGHTYCSGCIDKMTVRFSFLIPLFQCPNDRIVTTGPSSVIPKNFSLLSNFCK